MTKADFGDLSDWSALLGPLAPAVDATSFVVDQASSAPQVIEDLGRKPDIDAINEYFQNTAALNPKAKQIKVDWSRWYSNLGWYDYQANGQKTFDEARNRRNAFALANDPDLEEIIAQGVTAEEQEGNVRRADSKGNFPEDKPPLIPTWAKVTIGVSALVGIALGIKTGIQTFVLKHL